MWGKTVIYKTGAGTPALRAMVLKFDSKASVLKTLQHKVHEKPLHFTTKDAGIKASNTIVELTVNFERIKN